MITQTLPAQSKSEMLALKKILVPVDFSPAPHATPGPVRIVGPTAQNLATRLAWHPFLVGMSPQLVESLTDCATICQFKKGEAIFREREVADGFYLIETGKVTLESSSGPDNPMFAWSWMFPPHQWTFTARATEPTTAIFLHGPLLRHYCEKDHSLGYELLKRMSFLMHQTMQTARNQRLHSTLGISGTQSKSPTTTRLSMR